uniref:Uncharacterized protein n=1 Tax=Candidatus Kentrum sp. TC TaxID=2126339 RepID=A0A450Z6D3_9GAMM|nr:MAG: hypothetical protein BECKTC1821D_GA0114238_10762 [Candidatus Kentron sp. TC]
MSVFDWNEQKNDWLAEHRGVWFEDVINALSEGRVLFDVEHPNGARYPDQRILCVDINGYAYICP